ncbi:outer membrane protein assembly factor BamE domain-containing protein [Desulfuromonas thiophila]|uniref:SmpA / OmlA family protein n=1 Tax=Desulfuromonas thiophila TaxID=57664 RepID=A0A1G7F084_9BACT|nr:outer membrane protein assembly factor BamE [Desulfuromonas thiophila]SDE69247.1 SmpA / OmlA family protein [Desulfuromonas thiophila]
MRPVYTLFIALSLFTLTGCMSAGRPFNVTAVPQIKIGQTTKADLLGYLGEPWRTGVEDGQQTWTYGDYRYSLFGNTQTRDLVIRFNPDGRVSSYSFNSTYPQDRP